VHKFQSPCFRGISVFTLAFSNSGSSEWSLLHDTVLAPSNSELAQEIFRKFVYCCLTVTWSFVLLKYTLLWSEFLLRADKNTSHAIFPQLKVFYGPGSFSVRINACYRCVMCVKQCKWWNGGQRSGKKSLANVKNTVRTLMSVKSRHAMIVSICVQRLHS
jgi:hypothetical protein